MTANAITLPTVVLLLAGVAFATLVGPPALATMSTGQKPASTYTNCAALNALYPHGVGRPGAIDITQGRKVVNFTVDESLYRRVQGRLDRDKDGIACERL